MNPAAFLGPFTPLPAPPAPPMGLVAPLGGGAATILPFTMQTQQQTEWCWAATSASIGDFYAAAGGAPASQCQVASNCLSGQPCCTNPTPCNLPYYLNLALTSIGHLAAPVVTGALPFGPIAAGAASVVDQIDAGRPLGCHIAWSPQDGHFVAIYGYDATTQDVDVGDPLGSTSTLPYSTFVSAYKSVGVWDYSYLTQ